MPKDVTVTFKDGSSHVYRNAPDNITPDEVEARASKEFGKPVASLSRGAAPQVKRAGYSPEGMLHDMAQPSKDAAKSLKQRVADPMARRFNNLFSGNWKGVIDDYKKLPAEIPLANLAGLEAIAAIPNGVVNMFARPLTDTGADALYNAGVGNDVSVSANRDRVNNVVGTVGGLASAALGGVKAPSKVPSGFKGIPKAAKPAKVMPVRAQRVQALQKTGVDLTPGDIFGGTIKNLEDAAATTSGSIRKAKGRANEQLNEAIMNDALSPIKGKVKGAGRDAVESMHTQVSDALNTSFDKAKFTPDEQLKTDVQSAARDLLPTSRDEAVQITSEFMSDASHPDGLSEAFARLNKQKAQASARGDGSLSDFIHNFQQSVLDNLDRTGSAGDADAVRKARDAFRRSLVPERAAAMTGATEGVPNPNQLFSAVKASDRTARKNAFAQGKAQYQDIAEAAKDVMGGTVPTSGTAERLTLSDPVRFAIMTSRNLALKFVYNKPVLKVLNDIGRAQTPKQTASGVSALRRLAVNDPDAARALAAITGGGNAFGQAASTPNMLGSAVAEDKRQKPK